MCVCSVMRSLLAETDSESDVSMHALAVIAFLLIILGTILTHSLNHSLTHSPSTCRV